MTDENVTWLTQEAYDLMVEELAYLRGTARDEIAAKIGQAREEGDLSENAGYHAAREEQGQLEAHIRQLQAALETAQITETLDQGDTVTPGATIVVQLSAFDQPQTYLVGTRELAKLMGRKDVGICSPKSPMGSVVIGARVGQTVSYTAPNGKVFEVKILEVHP